MKRKALIIGIFLLAAIAGLWTSIAFHRLDQAHNLRRSFHYPLAFVDHLKKDPEAGKKIYQEYCASCHAPRPLIDVHAPRIGYANDWRSYSGLGKKALLMMVNRGVGAMPARGGCFECDDLLLEKAINYMTKK